MNGGLNDHLIGADLTQGESKAYRDLLADFKIPDPVDRKSPQVRSAKPTNSAPAQAPKSANIKRSGETTAGFPTSKPAQDQKSTKSAAAPALKKRPDAASDTIRVAPKLAPAAMTRQLDQAL
jgi:hypothetical protein